MGVGGWYESLAAGWLADMRSKQVPTSTTSARRLAALSKLLFLLCLFALFIFLYFTPVSVPSSIILLYLNFILFYFVMNT